MSAAATPALDARARAWLQYLSGSWSWVVVDRYRGDQVSIESAGGCGPFWVLWDAMFRF